MLPYDPLGVHPNFVDIADILKFCLGGHTGTDGDISSQQCLTILATQGGTNCLWCTKPWAFLSQIFGRENPNTLTYLNLPTKEMSEIDAKLTLNDDKRH